VLCVSGREEKDSICPEMHGGKVRKLQMPGGHHFHHEYATIINTIFNAMETIKTEGEPTNVRQPADPKR